LTGLSIGRHSTAIQIPPHRTSRVFPSSSDCANVSRHWHIKCSFGGTSQIHENL
jgi:hypothetical protein